MEAQKEEEETFGKQVHLFKKERRAYKGYEFGKQRVDCIRLEREFQLILEHKME